ncbi:amino acid ABC transporter permease [Aquabacterium sp.]|uniref:amino acid ABC transporter permease n=1 Tax=Aquabacterium sp. TaxID=1872578 RepID=UPI002CEA3359|nr:amino acid ABC transporter permease [Aquabacterium sp.]HSW08694.1 amino acid ABC transporter permease [Aquabacterium sp.]
MDLMRLWPAHWSRPQRSSAALATGALLLIIALWGLGIPLAWAPEPIGSNAQQFAEASRITMLLTLVSGGCGVVLGMLAALGKLSRLMPLRWLAGGYIWVMRGTPLLVQVLFAYFALPQLVPALNMSEFSAACVALSFNVGAYNAEAIRAGLLAVPRGQVEAARALGLNRWHTFIDISFPQAIKIALPPLVNNLVALLKDSSLAYTIGVVELTTIGNRIQAATFQATPTLVTTALIYLLLTTLLTLMSDAIERRFDVEQRLG